MKNDRDVPCTHGRRPNGIILARRRFPAEATATGRYSPCLLERTGRTQKKGFVFRRGYSRTLWETPGAGNHPDVVPGRESTKICIQNGRKVVDPLRNGAASLRLRGGLTGRRFGGRSPGLRRSLVSRVKTGCRSIFCGLASGPGAGEGPAGGTE